MIGVFVDAYATWSRNTNGTTTTLGRHLPIQLDTINVEILLEAGGEIPVDRYALYSFAWIYPVPQRGDYFTDEATGISYQVFGVVKQYLMHLECACTRYDGAVP